MVPEQIAGSWGSTHEPGMGRSGPVDGLIYAQLTDKFAENETFALSKGGEDFTYVTAEAVTTRLNTVLGVDGWEFEVEESGHDESHAWVRGRLTVRFDDRAISRVQFGECAINQGMRLGDARKGACSDAMKKCASLFGVGLYLSHREEKARSVVNTAPPPRQWHTDGTEVPGMIITCETCGEEIQGKRRDNGSVWSPSEIAEFSRRKYQGRVLCYSCSRAAG